MSSGVKYVVGSARAMRRGDPALVRYGGREPLPTRAECDALAGAGILRAVVERPFDAHAEDGAWAVSLVRFLRDAVAFGITTEWTVSEPGSIAPDALMHLSPPTAFPGHEAALERWRDFTFGVLYWRRGPGFVLVQDLRPGFDAASYCIDDEACLHAFAALQTPALAAAARSEYGEAYETLASANLVLEAGQWVVALPFRIAQWPIPYAAI